MFHIDSSSLTVTEMQLYVSCVFEIRAIVYGSIMLFSLRDYIILFIVSYIHT